MERAYRAAAHLCCAMRLCRRRNSTGRPAWLSCTVDRNQFGGACFSLSQSQSRSASTPRYYSSGTPRLMHGPPLAKHCAAREGDAGRWTSSFRPVAALPCMRGGGGSLHVISALVARRPAPAPAPRRLLAGHVVLLSRRVHCRTLCSDRVSFDLAPEPSVCIGGTIQQGLFALKPSRQEQTRQATVLHGRLDTKTV